MIYLNNYWNVISKKHLQSNNIKTTYNKSFNLKFKDINLASEALIKKQTYNIHIFKIKQMFSISYLKSIDNNSNNSENNL